MQARRLNKVHTADMLQFMTAHNREAAAASSNSMLMLRVREMQRWCIGTSASPDQ